MLASSHLNNYIRNKVTLEELFNWNTEQAFLNYFCGDSEMTIRKTFYLIVIIDNHNQIKRR